MRAAGHRAGSMAWPAAWPCGVLKRPCILLMLAARWPCRYNDVVTSGRCVWPAVKQRANEGHQCTRKSCLRAAVRISLSSCSILFADMLKFTTRTVNYSIASLQRCLQIKRSALRAYEGCSRHAIFRYSRMLDTPAADAPLSAPHRIAILSSV